MGEAFGLWFRWFIEVLRQRGKLGVPLERLIIDLPAVSDGHH